MKNIIDLRLIIGVFFLLVGIFLFIGSFLLHPAGDKSEVINRWSGVVYIVFGIIMLALWKFGRSESSEA